MSEGAKEMHSAHCGLPFRVFTLGAGESIPVVAEERSAAQASDKVKIERHHGPSRNTD